MRTLYTVAAVGIVAALLLLPPFAAGAAIVGIAATVQIGRDLAS